jgi:hypothetical protein
MSRQISPIVCNASSRFDSRSFSFGSFGLRGRALFAVAAFDAADFIAGRDLRFGAIMCWEPRRRPAFKVSGRCEYNSKKSDPASMCTGSGNDALGELMCRDTKPTQSRIWQRLLLGYRDDMRVEVEHGIPVTAKTVADLRAVTT